MNELNNIWNADDELNEEQLLNYINGKLTEAEANAFEQQMAGSSFLNDSVEGLQQFSSPEKINVFTQQLNESLRKKIAVRKKKSKRSFKGLSWELIAIIAVIVLCVLTYAVIELMRR